MSPSPQPPSNSPSVPETGPFDFPETAPVEYPGTGHLQTTSSSPLIAKGPAYDFTKKKRWADLALSDVVEQVSFLVKSSLVVLYSSSAISEGLGWREADFVDAELTEYINEKDHDLFRDAFKECLETQANFEILVRMKAHQPAATWTDSDEAKVYVRGHVRMVQSEVGESEIFPVVLLSVSQYDERLQAILELQMERMQLEFKLMRLREEATPEILAELAASSATAEGSTSFYTSSTLAIRSERESEDSPIDTKMESISSALAPEYSSSPPAKTTPPADAEEEEGSKKKKSKKSHPTEQHVCKTCGRIDSPEWRKGPLGPKTLCNACGLRWAKQNRKPDEPEAPTTSPAREGSSNGSTPGSNNSENS